MPLPPIKKKIPGPRFLEASKGITNLVGDATKGKMPLPREEPPKDEKKPDGNAIPADIFAWMKGDMTVPPARLAKMMADISNKMGYYIAYMIIQRFGSLNSMMTQLQDIEERLFVNKSFAGLSDAQLMTTHNRLKNTVQDFLEFARRFSIESKDIIIDPERDELVNLVRSLDAEGLKAVKELLGQVKKARTGTSESDSKGNRGVSIDDFEEGQGRL
jgi:hypothetical protein